MLGVGTSPAPLTEAQLQGKRQQLDTTRKRMAAVAKQLDRLQKEEDASAPPMFAHRHPRRPVGLSDSLRSRDLVPLRRALGPMAPAPPGDAGPAPLTPRGSPRFRRVAEVQASAAELFRQSQRDFMFADAVLPPPQQQPLPPPPQPPTPVDSNALLREFEEAWLEAGHSPSPTRAVSAPQRSWRWRAPPSATQSARSSRKPTPRDAANLPTSARQAPRPAVTAPAVGVVNWERVAEDLRGEEQVALQLQFQASQPMNSSVEMMASGWKHFTTPRWVAEPLDKPELYTYTLRRRRVRVAKEPTPEPTPEPPEPEPEREPTPPPPPPPRPDGPDVRVARESEKLDLPYRTVKHLATHVWSLLQKARWLLVAESIEQLPNGEFDIVFSSIGEIGQVTGSLLRLNSAQWGAVGEHEGKKHRISGKLAEHLQKVSFDDVNEDEMEDTAMILQGIIPLLEALAKDPGFKTKAPLPTVAKLRVYCSGLLAKCTDRLHDTITALNTIGSADMEYDALADLRRDFEAGPSGAAHMLVSRAHAVAAERVPHWQKEHEFTHTYGEFMVPAAKATHQAMEIRPTDRVLENQLQSQRHSIKRYRHYHDPNFRGKIVYPEWGGHEPEPEMPEVETTSKWDLVLERVKDILVDQGDHRLTRNNLLVVVPMLLEKYAEYVQLKVQGNPKDGLQRITPAEVHDGPAKYQHWIESAISKLWGDDSQGVDPQGNTVEDIVDEMEHPTQIMTLEQLRQLCLDAKITCRELLQAQVGRLWLKSCRKDCVFSGPTAEHDGTTVFTIHDRHNPHDTRNEGHVFEYLEVVIRLAHARYHTKCQRVGEMLTMLVKENLKKHKTPMHVMDPKKDGKKDTARWETLDPEVQEVTGKMMGGIEYLYRYFALLEDADSGVMTAAEMERMKEDAAKIQTFWSTVDTDGSGKLDSAELKQVLTQMGKEMDDEAMVGVMKEIDVDGSGEVEMEEFNEWCVNSLMPALRHL